jgi:hypothetical protein
MNDLRLKNNTYQEIEPAHFLVPDFYFAEEPMTATDTAVEQTEAVGDQLAIAEKRYEVALEDAALTRHLVGDTNLAELSAEDQTMWEQVHSELEAAYDGLVVETVASVPCGTEEEKISTANQYAAQIGWDLVGKMKDANIANELVNLMNQAQLQREQRRKEAEAAYEGALVNTVAGAAGRWGRAV